MLDRVRAREAQVCRRITLHQQANNPFEHFEIASYKSLLALADPAGATSAKPVLEASLREEEQMASWIDANVQKVTMEYLAREQRAAT